jgi:hypothetical protein
MLLLVSRTGSVAKNCLRYTQGGESYCVKLGTVTLVCVALEFVNSLIVDILK